MVVSAHIFPDKRLLLSDNFGGKYFRAKKYDQRERRAFRESICVKALK